MGKESIQTREANCRVCREPFIATRRGKSGLWSEVCKRSACRGFGLFSVKAPVFPRTQHLRFNEIDGGGQNGRFVRGRTGTPLV